MSPRDSLPVRDWLIGIGSNVEPQRWLGFALTTLRHAGLGGCEASQPAWSPAWERAAPRPPYLNALLLIRDSTVPAWQLRRLLLQLESATGRTLDDKAQGRVALDLDLLGRRRDGRWKWWPRRQAELQRDYWRPHLAELQLSATNAR